MIKETKIKIGEKEYLIKQSYRSLLEFEERTGRSITEMHDSIKDLFILFYCIIISNNQTDLKFDDFVKLIDEHQEAMDKFNDYLISLVPPKEEHPEKKKRETRSK